MTKTLLTFSGPDPFLALGGQGAASTTNSSPSSKHTRASALPVSQAQMLLATGIAEQLKAEEAGISTARVIVNPDASDQRLMLDTLVKQGSPDVRARKTALRGHWLDAGVMMLAPAENHLTADWARTCVEHQVARVVDLSMPQECARRPLAIDVAHKPLRVAGWEVCFERAGATDPALLAALPRGAQSLDLTVRATAPARIAGAPGDGRQALQWLNIPIQPGEVVGPEVLLSVLDHIDGAPLQEGETVAFQSPAGDDRAATFAAGHALYKRIRDGAVTAGTLQEGVFDECLNIKKTRSPELLRQPGPVASLLGMGQLLLDRENRGRLLAEQPMNGQPGRYAGVRPVRSMPLARQFVMPNQAGVSQAAKANQTRPVAAASVGGHLKQTRPEPALASPSRVPAERGSRSRLSARQVLAKVVDKLVDRLAALWKPAGRPGAKAKAVNPVAATKGLIDPRKIGQTRTRADAPTGR